MELQAGLVALHRAGVSVFAISYDPVTALAGFATRHSITYPLLSDGGSHVIRTLGLLNEQAPANRIGIAYPGTFMLDERGQVVDKHFEQGHRVRPVPEVLLERHRDGGQGASALGASALGGGGMPSSPRVVVSEAERDGVFVTAWLGQATFRPWQQLQLHVSLSIAPKLHVYAEPAPEGLSALSVSVSGEDIETAPPAVLSAPRLAHVEGIVEPSLVYEKQVEVVVPFHVTQLHPTLDVEVVVRFQACASTLCYPPETVRRTLPLAGVDLVRE